MTQANATSAAIETSDESLLASLFADLEGEGGATEEILETADDGVVESGIEALDIDGEDEVIETTASAEDADADLLAEALADLEPAGEEAIEAAVANAEREEAKHKLYAEQDAGNVTDGSAPATDAATVDDAEEVEGGKKAKKAKTPKTPKEPKPARPTSVTHKPGDLMKVKLGEKANDFLVFDMNDAVLPAAELQAKVDAFVERMNDGEAIADKVKDKITMLLTWIKTGGTLNTVLERTLRLLAKDGQLTSGDKGNLQIDLLAKPFSLGTSRSQSNQMFMALPEVGVCLKEKGRMVPNPDSTLLPIINSMLGL